MGVTASHTPPRNWAGIKNLQNLAKKTVNEHMKKKFRILKRRAVLLEYTLLLCSILPLVFGASAMIYSSSWLGGDFGTIGEEIVHFYQRIVTIVSLPIP